MKQKLPTAAVLALALLLTACKDPTNGTGGETATALYSDYLYRITVTGNWEGTNISVTEPTRVGDKVSITSFMADD